MSTSLISRVLITTLGLATFFPVLAQETGAEVDSASVNEEVTSYLEDDAGSLLDGNAATGLEDSPGGFALFPGLKIDLIGSASYIYDSNTTQTPVADSASVFAFGFSGVTKAGKETDPGSYYALNYNAQAFMYTDSADDFGRDPYEQYFSGTVGVNGGKTRLRFDANYHRNNGNSIQWDNIQRETRRAASHDYGFAFSGARDLFRGELLFGAGYTLRDFDPGTGFGDGENTYGDLAWMTSPAFAPKSSVGLGLRFGSDEYDGNPSQDFTTPSFRWNYRVSRKTSINNTLGYEFRSIDTPGSVDSENLVYNGGIDWAATSKTGFNLSYYRNVLPSYVLTGEDSTNTGVALQMRNNLPGLFELSSRVGYENAGYFAGAAGAASNRDDDFVRLSFELTHPLMITERLRGQWALFVNYNQNDSSQAASEFEQTITGLRFALVY